MDELRELKVFIGDECLHLILQYLQGNDYLLHT